MIYRESRGKKNAGAFLAGQAIYRDRLSEQWRCDYELRGLVRGEEQSDRQNQKHLLELSLLERRDDLARRAYCDNQRDRTGRQAGYLRLSKSVRDGTDMAKNKHLTTEREKCIWMTGDCEGRTNI